MLVAVSSEPPPLSIPLPLFTYPSLWVCGVGRLSEPLPPSKMPHLTEVMELEACFLALSGAKLTQLILSLTELLRDTAQTN